MKLITAIVRPTRLEAIKESLAESGFHGLTVSDVMGAGRQRGHTEIYRGHEYHVDLQQKVKLEIAVPDDRVDLVTSLVAEHARSHPDGKIGDGKVFVVPLENVVRVRTGEKGEVAV